MRNLKKLREDKDIKQKTIAEYLEVSESAYSKYENGKVNMTPEMLMKLSHYFNVSADYLIGTISYPISMDMMEELKQLSMSKLDFVLGRNEPFFPEELSLEEKRKEVVELFNSLSIEELRRMIKIIRSLQE